MGIMVTLVTGAYLWGKPLVEKQTDTVKIDNAVSLMKEINEKIIEVARHGGKERLRLNVPGEFRIVENDINDTIEMKFKVSGTTISTGNDIVLVGGSNNTEGVVGDEPGIVTIRADPLDGSYEITLKVFYRLLSAGSNEFYKIDLISSGRNHIENNRDFDIVMSTNNYVDKSIPTGTLHLVEVEVRFE
ncbi:MAG: hypothetical protein DRP11_02480 [Candidatus Aenigmatarchaeota archaeon]|nr:MAG: hypothetical protein DRP11_02480 [Candidatus Aenigmarchaeota archaeon]